MGRRGGGWLGRGDCEPLSCNKGNGVAADAKQAAARSPSRATVAFSSERTEHTKGGTFQFCSMTSIKEFNSVHLKFV